MLDNKQNILTFLIEHRLFAPSVSAFATLLGYVNLTDLFYLLQNTETFQIKRLCVFRTLSKSPPEASLRPYFFVSSFSFLTGSSFFTDAERISR